MLPQIPETLKKIGSKLPRATAKPIVQLEDKIAMIKKKFNLTHGKGKHKNRKKGR
jgi:hypothetical protein